jgi:ABC-type glycerol-3-phosphate transport system substrate-binding protein
VEHGRVARRACLVVLASGALAFGLAACGGASGTLTVTSTSTAPSTTGALTSVTAPPSTQSTAATSSLAAATTKAAAKATPTPRVLSSGKKAAVTVEWLINYNDQDLTVMQQHFLPAFQQANPGIGVNAIIGPGGIIAAQEKYLTMATAGTPPDLFNVTRPVANLARQQLYAPLDALIARDKFVTTKYNQALFGYESTLGGKTYGLPLSVQAEAVALAYNRDLFRKVGLAEPPTKWGDSSWTWENFVAAAQKLTVMSSQVNTLSQSGIGGLAYNVHLPVLWEGTWVSPRLDQATCDTPAMTDTYTSYFDLSRKYKVMPGYFGLKGPGGGSKDFQSGKVAMTTVGSWTFAAFRAMTVDWAFAPWPKATRSAYAFNPEEGSIAKASKYLEQTWTFLQWLDAGSRYASTFSFMPMITSDAGPWAKDYFGGRSSDVRPQVLSDSLVVAQPTDPVFLVTGSDDFVNTTIGPAITKQMGGGGDVKTALASVKGPLQALVQACGCSGSAPPY